MTEVILVMNGLVTKSYWKLICGQINDMKHTKTFISRPFDNSLNLQLVSDLYFFAHGARVGWQKKFFSLRGWKKTFSHRFWWVGQDFFFLGHRIALPCCGYSLESHWGCVFNEYPQSVLWRNKQNYHQRPSLPVPLPVCPAKTQISLGIHPVWSESSLSAHWAVKVSRFLHVDSEDSDQKGQMPNLIWVFSGLIGHFVGFIMLQLFLIFWNSLTVFEKETRFLPMTDPTLFDRVE